MKYWETYFYAVSRITGEVTAYPGMHLMAPTYEDAMKFLKDKHLDYINLTGGYYESLEEMQIDEKFYKKLTNPKNIVKDMSYDDFVDWLDLADDKEDLLAARDAFEREEGMEEYVKIINSQIRHRYGKKKKSNKANKEDKNSGETEDKSNENNS